MKGVGLIGSQGVYLYSSKWIWFVILEGYSVPLISRAVPII
jgi:hypothetical protein